MEYGSYLSLFRDCYFVNYFDGSIVGRVVSRFLVGIDRHLSKRKTVFVTCNEIGPPVISGFLTLVLIFKSMLYKIHNLMSAKPVHL